MAAKDLFHDAVKQALLKDDWVITADPLKIKIEGVKLEIDLAAEKVIAAQKAVKFYQVKLIIYDPVQEVVIEWKN
ncbi:element excision factor XisH family protein [Calothrix rhizosoleniae]|uniref:element excision factor XisH family protein n=1 Tax=Calothrix rhizosoleniae TaxID=888997 RepID=UPI000B4A2991|nr:element excision factor XisH family protein [Calothrix rhizosoleniae]